MNETLLDFVIARIAEQPAQNRIALYRALAAEVKDDKLSEDLRSVANLLEDVERNHLQMTLDLRRRQSC